MASPEQAPAAWGGEAGGAVAVLGERFELRRRIGEGGFGEVYEAFDRKRGAVVALKLPHDNLVARQQFKQEFRALADLVHPNLVTLYELETTGDRWFFTMELVRGRTFLDEVWRSPLPPQGVAMSSEPGLEAYRAAGGAPPVPSVPSVPAAPFAPVPREGSPGEITAQVPPAFVLEGPSDRLRPPVQLDRLYPVLLQLRDGLEALHAAGTLHRDVKPSNVLVTEEGRVVLLDFGLARELTPPEAARRRETQIVGTPGYMSPEQMTGQPLTAASDWYSVGVMLYEALTGRLPFIGLSVELLLAQQQQDPPPPSRFAPDISPELESLCLALLRPDPAQRPSGAEIRAWLLGLDQDLGRKAARAGAARWRRSEERLVGRERHLQLLWQAYGEAVAGETVVALCSGSSGMGKSALVRQFRHQLGQREGTALVLHSRCYEHEEMPFKAVDGIADGLADWLRGLGREEAEALVQQEGWALGRLFPALFQVEAVARSPWRQVADATILRQAGFFALRKLLGRIAKDHPVVLVIDDLQWGDLDSVALLTELLRMPGAPPLFLVVVYRAEEAETSPVVRGFRGMLPGAASAGLKVHELEVAGLDPAEALALALEFGGEAERAQAIALETGGNPFFITELAQHASGAPAEAAMAAQLAAGGSTVDACIRVRIGQLPLATQRLLEVVVVSGQPLRREVARQVAEMAE
ncbi:MAG TPA: protein kinase, partial [Polyangia bacterium]|nr:protein kinase [Polyangia bacterium]